MKSITQQPPAFSRWLLSRTIHYRIFLRGCSLNPDQAVYPVEQTLQSWLRHVYRLLREVGRIGVPDEPTLAALKDPDAPTSVVPYRRKILHRGTIFTA